MTECNMNKNDSNKATINHAKKFNIINIWTTNKTKKTSRFYLGTETAFLNFLEHLSYILVPGKFEGKCDRKKIKRKTKRKERAKENKK